MHDPPFRFATHVRHSSHTKIIHLPNYQRVLLQTVACLPALKYYSVDAVMGWLPESIHDGVYDPQPDRTNKRMILPPSSHIWRTYGQRGADAANVASSQKVGCPWADARERRRLLLGPRECG